MTHIPARLSSAHSNQFSARSTSLIKTPDLFVAPFSIDGELAGVAGRSFAELSPRWLAFCRQLIDEFGPVFKRAIPIPRLAHITVQLTTIDAASLVNIHVRDRVATSAIALFGCNPQAEREALTLFVDSLRRTSLVQQAAPDSKPFEAAFTLNDRPLYIVVPWPDPQISDEDQGLVQELDNHLAAAILGNRRA